MRHRAHRYVGWVLALGAAGGFGDGLGAQAPTTRLEGLVLDPLSRPVANARITVEIDGDVVARTQTDGLGTFVLGKVPAQRAVVRATTAVPDVGTAVVDLFAEPRGFALLHVMPARQVAGIVRDDAGKAVAGAWVACTPRGNGFASYGVDSVGSHTQSDAEGRYVLTHVPFGKVALRAWAAGLAGFAGDVDGTADATVDCTLQHGELQQRSFEIVDATPAQIAAAKIHVSAWADGAELLLPPALRVPTLDAAGSRKVLGWPNADEMRARAELAATFVWPTEMKVPANTPNLVNRSFYFASGDDAFVRGRVVGDGVPSAGVVLLAEGPKQGSHAALRTTGTTEPDGTFVLATPVERGGGFQLRCADPEFVLRGPFPGLSTSARTMASLLHTPDVVHQLVLRPALTVRCTLRDGGAPVAGAAVALLGPARFRGGSENREVFALCCSSVDGTVELRGLNLYQGERVVCEAHGPRGIVEHEFLVRPDLVRDLGVLKVGPGATLHIKVRTAAGKPVAVSRLQIQNNDRIESGCLLATDREGDCMLIGLVPGPYTVRIVGQQGGEHRVSLSKGEITEVLVQSTQ